MARGLNWEKARRDQAVRQQTRTGDLKPTNAQLAYIGGLWQRLRPHEKCPEPRTRREASNWIKGLKKELDQRA